MCQKHHKRQASLLRVTVSYTDDDDQNYYEAKLLCKYRCFTFHPSWVRKCRGELISQQRMN